MSVCHAVRQYHNGCVSPREGVTGSSIRLGFVEYLHSSLQVFISVFGYQASLIKEHTHREVKGSFFMNAISKVLVPSSSGQEDLCNIKVL